MHNRDPWYKTSFKLEELTLGVPHDVFSTQRIDEGTLLLLEHLPARAPQRVLDMGCGYGALGLPIAARYPDAQIEMVDRDLLAVRWSAKNAEENGLGNVHAYGSLGFRDLKADTTYDWVLCNVPARIGTPFIESFLATGRAKLTAEGELRVVVIRDLAPVLVELADKHGWRLTEVAVGPRHSIFALPRSNEKVSPVSDDLYRRDDVDMDGLTLERPFDLGGDDPARLKQGLPLLRDVLPRQPRRTGDRILVFRCGYGQVPLLARRKWPESKVTVIDRDLLGTTFLRRNAGRLELAGDQLEIRESAHFPDALAANEQFDLVLGELSPSAGEAVAKSEIEAIRRHLAPGGTALLLGLTKFAKPLTPPLLPLIQRAPYSVFRL